MTGRFTGALGLGRGEEKQEVAALAAKAEAPAKEPAAASASRRVKRERKAVDVRVEPKHLIQARVTRSQKHQFRKTLMDIQDFFDSEVTQEEGIGALLILASEDMEVREKWMDTIERLRQK